MTQGAGTRLNETLPGNAPGTLLRRRPVRAVAAGMAWFIHHATWHMRRLEYGWSMVERELATTVRVPWRKRPAMWRRGFLSESRVLYGFPDNDWRDYLPDYARFAKTRMINGDHAILLDDKLALQRILGSSAGGLLPAVYGTIARGQIVTPERTIPYCASGRWLAGMARDSGRLVVKPSRGGGGRSVHLLQAADDDTILDGRRADEDELRSLVAAGDGHMICEHVSQHPDLACLYADTTNTLRVLLMQDEYCHPFIAAAVLRIGTAGSFPTDNWSRGGLCAEICTENGVVGQAALFPAYRDEMSWCGHHPETGAPITGLHIPNWDAIRHGLIELMRSQPAFRYVGWDVVVTRDGFRILEGNNFSNVNLIQIHRPLLRDDRVAGFYRRNGVLPAALSARSAGCRGHSI